MSAEEQTCPIGSEQPRIAQESEKQYKVVCVDLAYSKPTKGSSMSDAAGIYEQAEDESIWICFAVRSRGDQPDH